MEIIWRESVDAYSDLPTTEKEGAAVYINDTGRLYVFLEGKWKPFISGPEIECPNCKHIFTN